GQRSDTELFLHESPELSGTVSERPANPSTPPRSMTPSRMSRTARATTSPRVSQSGEFGLASGRHLRQARKPASAAAAAVLKNSTFSGRGVRAGHEGRQKIPVVRTAVKNMPSKRLSREVTA